MKDEELVSEEVLRRLVANPQEATFAVIRKAAQEILLARAAQPPRFTVAEHGGPATPLAERNAQVLDTLRTSGSRDEDRAEFRVGYVRELVDAVQTLSLMQGGGAAQTTKDPKEAARERDVEDSRAFMVEVFGIPREMEPPFADRWCANLGLLIHFLNWRRSL